jgi:DNA-binding FadR family transcriptional regulator
MIIHRLHADIVEAVLSGDAERAREAVRRHYVGVEERISGAAAVAE